VFNEDPFFLDAMEPAYSWRRLFTTKNGFIGLGPRSAKPGDEIWYLSGQSNPYVLRRDGTNPKGNDFTLVGAALVHGIQPLGELNKKHNPVRIQLV